jgi:ubiquinone biosynthesis protein UbiJ
MIKQQMLSTLEKTLNHILALDPEFFSRLKRYEGQTLKLEFTQINITWIIKIGDNRFYFLLDEPDDVATTIRGTPFSLLHVYYHKANPAAMAGQQVDITGDLQFAQAFLDVLNDFEIDWEEFLATAIGDSAAHFIGERIRNTLQWLSATKSSLSDNLTDYLQEEQRILPTPVELDHFYKKVDLMRHDIERAVKRVERLETKIEHGSNETN